MLSCQDELPIIICMSDTLREARLGSIKRQLKTEKCFLHAIREQHAVAVHITGAWNDHFDDDGLPISIDSGHGDHNTWPSLNRGLRGWNELLLLNPLCHGCEVIPLSSLMGNEQWSCAGDLC